MYSTLILPDLKLMLEEGDSNGLREFCNALHPAVIAEVLELLPPVDAWRVLSHCELIHQIEIFEYMNLAHQVVMIGALDRSRLGQFIEQMSSDDRADLLSEMDPEQIEALMPLIAQAERADIRRLLSYPEGSAGSVMTTEYASLPENITAREAIERLRNQAPNSETIYYVYIVDDNRRLDGFISLRELILARPTALLAEIMQRDVIFVRVTDDQELVAHEMGKYNFLAIPVVDEQNRLVGIVTHDDILDVIVEEATEDVHRLGAVAPMTENYLEAPFLTIWRKRVFWLGCLFLAELLSFTALSQYESMIATYTVLSLFIPLCLSTGGNSGSQAATLSIRAMAIGDVTPRDWGRVFRHELLMGLALGLMLGMIGFVRVLLTPGSVIKEAPRLMLSVTIFLAVTFICLWGTLVGAMLPFVFRRLGIDPSIASSPFVATSVDCTGIVIYFSIASVCLF